MKLSYLFLSSALCPKSFEPLSLVTNPNRRTIRLVTGLKSGTIKGNYKFGFGPSYASFSTDVKSFSNIMCKNAVENLVTVSEASCIREEYNELANTASYLITLEKYPLKPQENNLFSHNGTAPIEYFSCNMTETDISQAESPYCEVQDVLSAGLPSIIIILFFFLYL